MTRTAILFFACLGVMAITRDHPLSVYVDETPASIILSIPEGNTPTVTVTVASTKVSGTVAITSGSTSVTGTGTSFLTELTAADKIKVDGNLYTIDTITNATSLTLTDNASTTESGAVVYLVEDLTDYSATLVFADSDGDGSTVTGTIATPTNGTIVFTFDSTDTSKIGSFRVDAYLEATGSNIALMSGQLVIEDQVSVTNENSLGSLYVYDPDSETWLDTDDIGVSVQAWDDDLDDISALAKTDGYMIVGNGTDFVLEGGATLRASIGVALGVDVQVYDAYLTSIAALGTAADKMLYTTGLDTAAEADLTAFARTILDDSDAATVRATIGAPGTSTFSQDMDGLAPGPTAGDISSLYFLRADGDWAEAAGVTTYLGLTDTPGTFTAGALLYTNATPDAVVHSGDLTFDGSTLEVGVDAQINGTLTIDEGSDAILIKGEANDSQSVDVVQLTESDGSTEGFVIEADWDVFFGGDVDIPGSLTADGATQINSTLVVIGNATFGDGSGDTGIYAAAGNNLSIATNSGYVAIQTSANQSFYMTCGGSFFWRDKDASNAVRMSLEASTGILTNNDLSRQAGAETVADDGSIVFATGVAGRGWVMAGDNEEYAEFRFAADGTVSALWDNTANTANSDSDTNLCILDNGSGIAIKNRLGASKTVAYEVEYFTP